MTARTLLRRARARLALAALVAPSCRAPTACAPPVHPVLLGSWSYAGTQSTPTAASLSGALQITSQCGQQIGGTLDVTVRDAQGNTQRLVGAVTGTIVDTASVDFDAFLDVTPRRHVGTLKSDTLSGTWFEQTGSGALSGSFSSVGTVVP